VSAAVGGNSIMLSTKQGEIIVGLVRRHAQALRLEPVSTRRLVSNLIQAEEALVPERFLMPVGACLQGIAKNANIEESALPLYVRYLFNETRRCSAENIEALKRFGKSIFARYGAATEDAVLAGDVAALATLYENAGAFPAQDFEALLKNGTCANGEMPKLMRPPAEEWSTKVRMGATEWRKPKPALLIALFARHVGDPVTPPMPPMWPHLGLALLSWKDRIAVKEVIEISEKLGRRQEVECGIVIAGCIFPEIQEWVYAGELKMPRWEKLAARIAARRLVLANYE
jgi:hypothetical protein